jgi:hypothetical protein
MPISIEDSDPRPNRILIQDILIILQQLRIDVSKVKEDIAYLRQKQLECEESKKGWIW